MSCWAWPPLLPPDDQPQCLAALGFYSCTTTSGAVPPDPQNSSTSHLQRSQEPVNSHVLLGPHLLRSQSEKHLHTVPLSSQNFPSLNQPTSQHLSLGRWRDGGHGSPCPDHPTLLWHSLEVARQPPSSCEDLACGRGSSPHSTALYFLAAESVLWDTVRTLFKLHPKEEAERQGPPALTDVSLHCSCYRVLVLHL